MAMNSKSTVSKQCATCEYWAGRREIGKVAHPNYVMVETYEKGRCMNRQSGSNGTSTGQGYHCACYKDWGCLG